LEKWGKCPVCVEGWRVVFGEVEERGRARRRLSEAER
jgi:hypothetical protein